MKTSKRRSLKSAAKPSKEPNLSPTHAPADLSPMEWQRGLRRQFGREQAFGLERDPCAARRIGAPVFDVLDECAEFGQDLTFPG